MTAVVGILNKYAVAIAADSAVSIDGINGRKIFNKANKVFTLSKYHPIGIMLYNSASFMGTPWETIIKVYRKQLNDRSFPTVIEYQQDFIRFLETNNYYTNPTYQLSILENFATGIVRSIISEIKKERRDIFTPAHLVEFVTAFDNQIDVFQSWVHNFEVCPTFGDYSFTDFEVYSSDVFTRLNQNEFLNNGINVPEATMTKLKNLTFSTLKSKEEETSYTGLIFTGFGDDEIYPQLVSINISMVVHNRLRFYVTEKSASITNLSQAAVRPFAQIDVINTILTGIAPSLDVQYTKNYHEGIKAYNESILGLIGDTNPSLSTMIRNLDIQSLVSDFQNTNNQIKTKDYIQPLMNAVSSLAKEDLAEMAESLIYLTYLKRRITFAEESVGGPVDVAVISKGDGFIWIKRKHYFKPELNQFFLDNYFKI